MIFTLEVMNNKIMNKNLDSLKNEILDCSAIQMQMKNKLGVEIYESWLKKINFLDEFNNYILLYYKVCMYKKFCFKGINILYFLFCYLLFQYLIPKIQIDSFPFLLQQISLNFIFKSFPFYFYAIQNCLLLQ